MSSESDHTPVPDENHAAGTSISNESAKRILTLLKAGDEKINLGSYHEAVLVLGNTGSGKTTFTQFIAGENDNMMSTEVGEDTGEYIISDINNKISQNSTVISKTTFPELVLDTETKTAYIDNPGFNDSRNEAYDIAAAYFIKKVLDTVKNVKIVLIISYPSLRKGVSRTDFLQLLEHITVLLKNIDKYTDSIALVATKVDNTLVMRKGVATLIDDKSVIDNMANFLTEVRQSLKTMLNGGETYISEMKRVESKLFYENSIKLLDALLTKKDSKYARLGIFRRPNEPGRVSQIQILQDGKKVIKNMVRQNLRYLPIDKTDIGYTVSDKSKNVIRDLVVEINKNIVADMAVINENILTYYRDFERKTFSDDMFKLHDRLETVSKALSRITGIDESTSAAEFVNIMSENFTSLGVRVSKSRLRDIANLGKFLTFLQDISAKKYESLTWKWTKELEGAVKYVDNSLKWYNFTTIMYQRLSGYEILKNRKSYRIPTLRDLPDEGLLVKDAKGLLDFLNSISDTNFLKAVNYEEVKKIRLDDTKVKFFDQLVQATLKDNPTYTCFDEGQRVQVIGENVLLSELESNQCYRDAQSVQIFATNTVFVDTSLTNSNDLSIIAPRWEIVGNQKINLDGQDGPPHSSHRAPDGQCPGCDGEDGKPGAPGTSAGHFIGIGSSFKDIENLEVTASGGAGSWGQDGGNGAQGATGQTFYMRNAREFTCDLNQICHTEVTYSKSALFNLNVQGRVEHTIYGSEGGKGGDAGRRGVGGPGGNAGKLFTFDTSDGRAFQLAKTNALKGRSGYNGSSGKPGQGGIGGNHVRGYLRFGTWSSTDDDTQMWGRSDDGSRGHYSYGLSEERPRQPDAKEFLYPPSLIISDYRNQLVSNLDNCVKKRVSSSFYQELQRNAKLDQFYDVNILLREFQHLEEHHHLFTVETAFMLYDSILKKILKTNSSNFNERLSLEFLRLSVASKLLRLQARPENQVTFDLRQRFQQKLKMPPVSPPHVQLQFVIDTLYHLVEDHVDPAIQDIDIRVIESSLQHSEEAGDHKLDELLLRRKLFGDLKTLTKFLQLLTALALIDEQVISNMRVDEILPSLKFQPVTIQGPARSILENRIFELEQMATSTVDALRTLISGERKLYENSADAQPSVVEFLRHIERGVSLNTYTCAKTFSTNDDLKNVMKSVEMLQYLKKSFGPDDFNPDEMEMIKRIVAHNQLIEFDADLYNRVNGKSDVQYLVDVLNNSKDSVDKLQTARAELVAKIVPILNTVRTDISSGSYNLDKISTTRATAIHFLDYVKERLHSVLQQFEIDEDLQSISENLDSILNALVNLYETAASTEDEMRLYSFWNAVAGPSKDSLRNDYLLFQYQRLADVFKRSVFPFDILGMEKFDIPVIPDNTNQISLEANLDRLQTTLNTLLDNPSLEYTAQDYFNSTSSQGALYEWRSGTYGKNIAKLLRGRSVVLTSFIDPYDQRQFLRFDSIRLRFQTLNETTQQSLDDALSDFSVRLVHSGSSYYAFCDRVHLFNGNLTEYRYDDETVIDVKPLTSPYTTWMVSLHPAKENATFRSLRPFVDQPIDLQLEGHAKYLNIENKTDICEQFDVDSMTADYTDLMTRQQPDQLVRRRRQVDMSKSWNPFSYVTDSRAEDSSVNFQSLDYNKDKPSSGSSFFTSFNFNMTLPLVDYVVRNFTKAKPYKSFNRDSSLEFDHLRAQVLRIVDDFETLCAEIFNETNSGVDAVLPDPVVLMGALEKPLVRGDRDAVREILRNSVRLDSDIEARFDESLDRMLNELELDQNNGAGVDVDGDQTQAARYQYVMDKETNLFSDRDFVPIDSEYNATLFNLE